MLLSSQVQSSPLLWNTDKKPIHLQIASQYIGHKEVRYNRSPVIDSCNRFVGVPLGSAYCATFVSWILDKTQDLTGKLKKVFKTGWAGGFRTKKSHTAGQVLRGIYKPKAGDIVMWNKGKSRIGHVGFVWEDWLKYGGKTLEANTRIYGSGSDSEGDGIGICDRKIEPYAWFKISYFTEVEYE